MAIANGKIMHPLAALSNGARCTWFKPDTQPKTARKRWIAGSVKPVGWVRIDAGAARALSRGKSLLPAGITEIGGRFERGDPIEVRDVEGTVLARGLSAYSAEDAKRIKGHTSGDIEAILGYRGRDEMIHRDDLVLEQP
jgi:glutamate 5-kinase